MTKIHSAAVLGAGTMGSQIAAHLANAGIPVLLLDLDRQTAAAGLNKAKKLTPSPFFTHQVETLISIGGFETDLARLRQVDWIIEAIVEQIDVKRELLAKVETHRSPTTIVSSNTSGISLTSLAENRSNAFRQHWLGTHFFNPPRYLHLLELIPTVDTKTSVIDRISDFASHALGKGIVIAKDTPSFIANRIGIYDVTRILNFFVKGEFTIEEIDAMTGSIMGRTKSATFRTLDIVGIDVLADVALDLTTRLNTEDERLKFKLPLIVEQMVQRGWIGQKSGQGFYKKEIDHEIRKILTLDPSTMLYRKHKTPNLAPLEATKSIDDFRERLRVLFLGNDLVGKFIRATLGQTLLYAANISNEISYSINDIDRAMRWGFGWHLGPFELWDTIGVESILESCDIKETPELIRDLKQTNRIRKFRPGILPPAQPDLQILRRKKEEQPLVKRNDSANLVDLGDGVLAVEFHSKMNTIGQDAIEMLSLGIAEAELNFEALVVGNDDSNFCTGANLTIILTEAQNRHWKEIDLMIKAFQSVVASLRHTTVPVIVSPSGFTLGGGCELSLHGDRLQSASETYMGLVEVKVGLIPAGGGTKELLIRNTSRIPAGAKEPFPYIKHAFELISFAKVSTSALHAKELGFLNDVDGITMNRERLMSDAKLTALELAKKGYQPPQSLHNIKVEGDGVRSALELGIHLAFRAGYISEHDVLIGRKIAKILAGGDLPHSTHVSDQYLLDLEREAFLSLCGETKTQERIAYTLKTGKTLRN